MYINANKGIYTCNKKRFYNKLEAILESNKSGKQVHWYFYDDVFRKYNWSKPVELSIDELYKMRAQQLRDEYDHLVLFYSGGVDSGYILKTFLENDIKIDEIYMYGAFDLEKKQMKKLGKSKKAGCYIREIEYIAKPLVKKLLTQQDVKINQYDWAEDIVDATNDIDWMWLSGCRFTPDQMVRNKFHKIFREHNDFLDKGKKVGFIYGIDKPRLVRDNNSIYYMFLDLITTTGTNNANDILGESWESDEFFYWTPNFPEIAVKQAQLVAEYFKKSKTTNKIRHYSDNSFHIPEYYKTVDRIVYPDWDHGFWQIDKCSNTTVGHELTGWFYDPDTTHFKKWKSSLDELERQLGKQWFNKGNIYKGLKGHNSSMYKVCDL
jgi:hypothetical protein